ncbi:MAG: hypothetical protein U5R31_05020 [Acidimicrobiia bacterium]|nr:hypothetical protein [Acidimicrobiia bacterium]
MLHAGHQTRLAPLYDLASALPYDTSDGHKLKLAMKLGREYRLRATDRSSSWHRLAGEVGLPGEEVLGRVAQLAGQVGAAFADAASESGISGLGSDLPERLVEAVTTRAEACLRIVT